MAEKVRTRVTNRRRVTPALSVHTDNDTASENEEPLRRLKIALKSGKVWTADTLVSKKITWPHKVVYNSQGQLAVYDNMA